jgi:hypothetical protein
MELKLDLSLIEPPSKPSKDDYKELKVGSRARSKKSRAACR